MRVYRQTHKIWSRLSRVDFYFTFTIISLKNGDYKIFRELRETGGETRGEREERQLDRNSISQTREFLISLASIEHGKCFVMNLLPSVTLSPRLVTTSFSFWLKSQRERSCGLYFRFQGYKMCTYLPNFRPFFVSIYLVLSYFAYFNDIEFTKYLCYHRQELIFTKSLKNIAKIFHITHRQCLRAC